MNGKVKVCAFEGSVIVPSQNNPEYGSIRLEQKVAVTSGGFVNTKTRSAFLNGSLEDLKALGWADGQMVDGHIIIKEALTPFNTEKPDADIKRAGETNVVCTIEGQPIYRRAYFSFTPEADVLIAHDNSAEIKAAQAKLQEEKSLEEG